MIYMVYGLKIEGNFYVLIVKVQKIQCKKTHAKSNKHLFILTKLAFADYIYLPEI